MLASEPFILCFCVVIGNKPFVGPCVSLLQDWQVPLLFLSVCDEVKFVLESWDFFQICKCFKSH